MGILPLQFLPGESAESLKLTGEEVFEITGIRELVEHFAPGRKIKVRASASGKTAELTAAVRIDTPQEAQYYANGGILQYVLRQLLAPKPEAVHV
jgi:aconitate hydratase